MDRDDLIGKLSDLAQMDFDAVRVYDEALEHVTDDEVRRQFQLFRGEHDVHAEQLSRWIQELGGRQLQLHLDMIGRLAEWVTAIRSARGTQGALHAMLTAERYHNRRYEQAAAWDVGDPKLAETLQGFFNDEKRHLAFVDSRVHATVGARE